MNFLSERGERVILDRQINLYSIDTGNLYTNTERELHNKNCKYRMERNYLVNQLPKLKKSLQEEYLLIDSELAVLKKYSTTLEKPIRNFLDFDKTVIGNKVTLDNINSIIRYVNTEFLIRHKREKAKDSKSRLLHILANKIQHMDTVPCRTIKENDLKETNVISLFDSTLTRTLNVEQNELTDSLMVLQVFYFDVFKDVMYRGFWYKGNKYKYFSSSAGQIRKKKAVFIKESEWNRIEKTIMCGLTVEQINRKGGSNVNKFLAYMALSNSATDVWVDFDIDKTIVINDFETNVYGSVDFVDETDYSITRMDKAVPVPHTDGCGMVLPELLDKNTMFRAPWVKGLLGSFDFKKFILENRCSPVIKDIYGVDHDVIKENIQIILTESQFKMHKYYDSWEEYKKYFKQYHCEACLCNLEEERIPNAKINYQMLQTLTDITDEEIELLAETSVKRISNICSNEKTMKDILGVTPYNQNKTYFQQAIEIYPSLLNDTYAKDVLREIKKSLLKKYRSGKLEINGKYTFLLPDFYAACEFWFMGIENPIGLLKNKEVFCDLFKKYDKLDCLRSPHLYKEHAVRYNVANNAYGERSENIRRWFTTKGIYTSIHDLISKELMFDVDGDRSLVVADQNFINIAERNMNGIVPLYYNMRKAEPTELNNENIYNGLNAAFTGGNIGVYSNNISKIWNSDVFINGTEEEKNNAVECVKRLCCQNNFVIDYAKTLYKPEFPDNVKREIDQYTKLKLPAFFEFAKDKTKEQIEKPNNSFMNKLYNLIPDKPINTRGLKLGRIEYTNMMYNINTPENEEIINLYQKLNKEYRYQINMKDERINNLSYIADCLRSQFAELEQNENIVTDVLVKYLYTGNKRSKQLLWFCYGGNIVDNLKRKVEIEKKKTIQCVDCGEWIEIPLKNTKTCRCNSCANERKKNLNRIRQIQFRNPK